ncbi:MAG TPA: C4-dicarboxylate ABC transporter, partial [Candidatus Accumulibacter sp.]|nr:C4-dicarboxylate ABC transporter [Accumulibacter sp.]
MTEFLINNMAPIIFASMVLFLLVGFPVSFALAANGIFFGLIGIELGLLGPQLFQALPDRIFGIMNNDTLLAIPFFTFMGLILERSGMAEDLLDTIGQIFGPLRGGLAFAVIFVGALLAATTGVVAASVISMGLISLPIMLRYGYNTKLATGVIAASGTLAQILPPALVLIIMADQLGKSVGDMYKGAFLPAIVLTLFYVGYVLAVALFKPRWAPALPAAARTLHGSKLLLRVLTTMVPPLMLIFLVLGTIFMGIATPTEGGAMGAVGALILAMIKNRLTWGLTREAMDSTAKLASFVLFILIGSTVFSFTFNAADGHFWVEHLFDKLPGGQMGFLIFVNFLVFVLGFFIDFFEIAFIVIPLLAPVAEKLDINLIWFGVLLAMNLQTSFLTPPFGFALFYLRSVAARSDYTDQVTGKRISAVTTAQIYKGSIAFIILQLIMVAVILLPHK